MNSQLELLAEDDMLLNGYNPDIWADVVEYWNERLG